MATSREKVNALTRLSIVTAWDRALKEDLQPRVEALLSQISKVCPPPSSDTFLQDLCDEMQQLEITKTPEETAIFFRDLNVFPDKQLLIVIANALRDDSRFNSQIWPRAQRLQAYYERVLNLLSVRSICKDATRELMVDLLHGQFFFSPGVGDGEPLYLIRNIETDCLKLVSEYYANQLAALLFHPELEERQRGYSILNDWIRYHFHQGPISKPLAEFLDNGAAANHFLFCVFFRQNLEFTLPASITTILQAPAELPPPYLPAYRQTRLTASAIGRYNGAISTLHDRIRDSSQYPAAELASCRTLEDVLPFRLAQIRETTLKKASQLAKMIPFQQAHLPAIKWAADITRHCSELSDAEFEEKIDFFDHLLRESQILLDSDEHGEIPDYFAQLAKANASNQFKSVYWKLQDCARSWIKDESIEALLQAAETATLYSLLTPRRLAYLLWPAFNTSPKDWSTAYATLVERITVDLPGWNLKSYPSDLISQLRWLHLCWKHDTLCPLPKEMYMPCNLSGLRIHDPIYFRNTLLWITTLRKRGWWVALPANMTLIDISNDRMYVEQMLSLCSYPQRLRELEKIWDYLVKDPSVFPMLFRVLKLNKPEHVEVLREFFPLIPSEQVRNCVTAVTADNHEILNALELTRPDQLSAVLGHFFPYHFDRAYFKKYEALFASLPDPVKHIKDHAGSLRLRMYRALCLALPDSTVNSHVKTLFSSEDNQAVAEQIYEVRKIHEEIIFFAKQNQITPSAAAIQLSEDSKLNGLIELWESKDSAHIVLRELLEDVDSLINMNQLLLLNSTHNHVKIP